MIFIKKKSPPELFIKAQKNGKHFDELNTDEKNELRESLLKEQHYICAYCMKAISNDRALVKVEHYIPQSDDFDYEMEYKNLLAVCYGNEGMAYEHQTCDTRKGDKLLKIDPQKSSDMETIYYSRDGKIHSRNDNYDAELNTVLNLNYSLLVENRKTVLDKFLKNLDKKYSGKHLKKKDWKKIEEVFCHKLYGENADPYCGIIWEYIKRKM